ncbi:MAG: BF3164 family lipoprotein [Candidatus Saccharicenans sp.]|nr:MAG: hypothetical protein C0168_03555 [Candidatus Aminicenantes bacterium]HEK86396.1 hypothetical protein [Candidatus Aminicenantes bacterium]
MKDWLKSFHNRRSRKKNAHRKTAIKLYIIIYVFFLIFIFIGCSSKSANYNYINYKKLKKPDRTRKLYSIEFVKFEDYSPRRIGLINNYLVLGDYKADKIVRIVDLKSAKLLKSFGRRGQGPDEFISFSQIIQDPQDQNSFWIFDLSTGNFKKFNIIKILNCNYYPEKIIKIVEETGIPFRLTLSPDGKILALGAFFKGRVAIYDTNGNFIRIIGKIPVKEEKFASQHSQGFQGEIVYRDKSNEIYVATLYGSIVEKYNPNGDLISTLYGPESFFPQYDVVPAGQYYTMAPNKKTRFGYFDICYNNKIDRLFLLYSGRNFFEKENLGNIIYVLDENDEILEQIELDKNIFEMEITEDGSTIFGLTENGVVLKFQYKSIGDSLGNK